MPRKSDSAHARLRPLRAAVASALASAVDVATLVLLAGALHVAAGWAAALGCIAGGVVNFALGRKWVFGRSGPGRARQAVSYGLVVVAGGAALAGLLVAAATSLGAPLVPARLLVAALLFAGWSYPLSSLVVFGKEPRA